MENIAHTLAGFALARSGLGRTTRFATTALVVGSNLPDIDAVILLKGRLAYVDGHRGITHSIVGGLVLGLLLGGALCVLASRLPGRGPSRGRTRNTVTGYGLLMGLSLLAVMGHLTFDLLNDYGIRLLLPFSSRWIYGDTIFVVDPWFWLVLGAGLYLAIPRTFTREAFAWAGWALLSIPVLTHPVVETPARIVWVLGLLALGVLRAVWRRPVGDPTPCRAALATLGVYVLVMCLLHVGAVRRATLEATVTAGDAGWRHLGVLAKPGDPLHWTVLFEHESNIVVTSVSSLPRASARRTKPRVYRMNLDRPEVRAALETPAGRTARGFCRYLFADIEDAPLVSVVALRDARFAIRGRDEFSIFKVSVPRTPGPFGAEPPARVDSPLISRSPAEPTFGRGRHRVFGTDTWTGRSGLIGTSPTICSGVGAAAIQDTSASNLLGASSSGRRPFPAHDLSGPFHSQGATNSSVDSPWTLSKPKTTAHDPDVTLATGVAVAPQSPGRLRVR